MENIVLNNGKLVTLLSNKDIADVIAESVSYDLSKLVYERIESVDSERIYAESRAETDAAAYESDLQNCTSLLYETLETLTELADTLQNANRLNRTTLYQTVQNLAKTIQQNL